MNKLKIKFLMFLRDKAEYWQFAFARYKRTLEDNAKRGCKHADRKAVFFPTMKYEYCAGYECNLCGSFFNVTPSEPELRTLYREFFEMDPTEELDSRKIWQNLLKNGGFNL